MFLKRFAFLLRPTGKIEVGRGLRTLLAIALPLVLGRLLHQPELGLMVGFGAQMMLLADVGGLYSIRAKTLLGTTLGITLALILGTWVTGWFWLTLIVVFLWLFGAGYLTVYGENGAAAGLVIGLALLFAINLPHGGIVVALERGAVALGGGLWAILLAFWLLPFQPNLPLRRVVAQNFQGLAYYLRSMDVLSQQGDSETREAQEDQSLSQIRQLLLQSRETLTYTRMGRWGRSDLRELLIVLIEDCDRIMTTLTAMREIIHLHPLPQLQTVEILLSDVLQQVATISEDIGQLILGKSKIPDCNRLKLLIAAIDQQQSLQHRLLETDVDDYTSYVTVAQLKNALNKLQKQLRLANQTAQQLQALDRWRGDKREVQRHLTEDDRQPVTPKPWWEPLQENFSLESPLFRHALRLGMGAALGLIIYTVAQIPHGLWIGLTLVIVLKPDFSLTFQRFFYRIIGTLLGSVAVALLLGWVQAPFWLEAVAVLSIAIALSLVRFHYSLAVFFITIYALILSHLHPDSPDINVVGTRVICTLIGAAIAFVLSFGFLRLKEEVRFSSATVMALQQFDRYFQAVMAVYLGQSPYDPGELTQIRYQARLANTQMQTALQRFIDDPSTPFAKMEPAITLASYVPRLGRGVTVLLTQLEQFGGSRPHAQVGLFTQQVTATVEQLARSLEDNQVPTLLPPIEATVEEILSHLQQLREARLGEIANHEDGSETHRYLRDYNIVATDFLEISRRLEAIHTAVTRFETAG